MSTRLFISFSPQDGRWVTRLRNHLAAYKYKNLIVWDNTKILGGQNRAKVIDFELNRADIILIIVSANYFGSDSCMDEMSRALLRKKDRTPDVIPVILRSVDWEQTPLGPLEPFPKNGKPIVEHKSSAQALRDVARSVFSRLKKPATSLSEAGSSPYFLNHTSFLRPDKQAEFRERTKINIDHYDIRVIIDSDDENALDQVEKVEYILHQAYPRPIQIIGKEHRKQHFLLKEIANGEYLLKAKIYISGEDSPIELQRFITLWRSGPFLF